jgi:hypothetical protein
MNASTTPLIWRILRVPKRGHTLEEYEDAAAGHGLLGRFAVADGATESAFAGPWASALAEAFVQNPVSPGGWAGWLPEVRRRWLKEVGDQELPWYLEEKFQQGAYATLLGIELALIEGAWEWQAVAVGDCCLFHLRGDNLLCSFPLERSGEFDTRPELLGSRDGDLPRDHCAKGRARFGDSFLLLSDALAQWALKREEARRPPWRELRDLLTGCSPQLDFEAWVEARWEAKDLKTDDLTLLAVDLPKAEDRP